MDEVEKMDETSGSLVKQVISPQCSARLSALTVWYVIDRACASMCSNHSLLQQAACPCLIEDLFKHKDFKRALFSK